MFLCDRTGQLNGRMWQASEIVYKSLPKPGFVHIQGRSELYQNNLQIVVNNIAAIDPSKVNVENYLARTTKDCGTDVQGGAGDRRRDPPSRRSRPCARRSWRTRT